MKPQVIKPLAISAAALLAIFPLQAMLTGPTSLTVPALVVGITGVVAMAGTLVRIPAGISTCLGLLAGLAVLVWQASVIAPNPNPWEAVSQLSVTGASELAGTAVPMAPSPALTWLMAGTALLLWLLAELLSGILEQPAWSIVPLALPYAVAAMLTPAELKLTTLAPTLAGYLFVLLASSPPRRGAGFQLSRWVLTGFSGSLALALSALITPALPMGTKQPWIPDGSTSPIQLTDPTVDLTENLNREDPIEVLSYRASDSQAHYLRATALTKLTPNGAQLAAMKLRPNGLSGAYNAPGQPVDLEISMSFPSQYLPAPFAPKSWDAAGEWGYDPNTLSIVATGEQGAGQTTALNYRVHAVVPTADDALVATATAGADPAGAETSEIPQELSPEVSDLLQQITSQATTDGQKALAIEAFLTSEEFTYTLDAPTTTGSDAISSFLLTQRSGYCIHYATSMAVLARLAGIPSRVAIGFTGGTPDGDRYSVTTDNMHAWPELYFEDLGWIPFEPTPGYAAAPSVPEQSPEATPTASPSQPETQETAQPTPSPTPSPIPSASPSSSPATETPPAQQPGFEALGRALGLILILLLVLLAPAGIRMLLAWLRLRPGRDPKVMAEDAWAELAATATDLGLAWGTGSPVIAAQQIKQDWSRSTALRLVRIADIVQRTRYAEQAPDLGGLNLQVRKLQAELKAQVSQSRRLLAFLLPGSLVAGLKQRILGRGKGS